MTCPTPFPERLNPPDAASECVICHRVTEDGRDIELCDEDVEGLRSLSMIRLSAAVETGKQWVCERCQQDLDAIHREERSDAFGDLAEALGWDLDEHPVIHAKRLIAEVRWMRAELQRIQSLLDKLQARYDGRWGDLPDWFSSPKEIRRYSWWRGEEVVEGFGLFPVGAARDSVPFQAFRDLRDPLGLLQSSQAPVDSTMPRDREELQKLLNDAYRRENQDAHEAHRVALIATQATKGE